MSDAPQGPGWWQASDGQWYPPEQAPATPAPPPPPGAPKAPPVGPPIAPPVVPTPAPAPPTGPTPYQTPAADASGQRPASVGDAFNWGWLKFQQNVGEIILVGIAAFVALIAAIVVPWFILTATLLSTTSSTYHCGTDSLGHYSCSGGGGSGVGFVGFLAAVAIFYTLFLFVMFMAQMAFIRGGLLVSYGEKLEMKKMISTENIGPYLIAALLVAVGAFVGAIFCIIPGIIVVFFSQFFGYFILDKKMSALDGIKASFQLVNKNLATMIGFSIASYIAYIIGYLLCGVGLVVAVPVIVIAGAFMYRRLQGEPVAA